MPAEAFPRRGSWGAEVRRSVSSRRTTTVRRACAVLWWAATLSLLGLAAHGLERRITWYLSVDQYGYLSFAQDLARGRVFHRWPPLDALAPRLPPVVDVLFQAYVYDHGRLYCRYAPGFPLLLAAWLRLFGDEAVHVLNPTVFLALLGLALAFQRRVCRSRWRALAGVGLVLLVRSLLHLWATTLVRDLSAHLAGLLGLFLLLPAHGRRLGPGRALGVGLALGYAAAIRPDAALYLLPGLLLAIARWHREDVPRRRLAGGLAAGALGLTLGLLPFLAYNWAATGSPLRPTQGMEIEAFLPMPPSPAASPATPGQDRVGYAPRAWQGGTARPVQGGGLRLENLRRTLPGNILLLRLAYGDVLLGIAVWGAILSLIRRRLLFLAAVPYTFTALLFFSCWGHPDPRYLAGIHLFVPMLVIEGTFGTLDVVRRLARVHRPNGARAVALASAAALAAGAALVPLPAGRTALPALALLVPMLAATSALGAVASPRRRIVGAAAPVLALALVGLAPFRGSAAWHQDRAPFQRSQMLRARATFAQAVAPGAVVITNEEAGRPAENIDYYSGVAHALYLTDLRRWRIPVVEAAASLARGGMTPYLLLPRAYPGRLHLIRQLAGSFTVERVADIPAGEASRYFVVSPYHEGLPMELSRLVGKAG